MWEERAYGRNFSLAARYNIPKSVFKLHTVVLSISNIIHSVGFSFFATHGSDSNQLECATTLFNTSIDESPLWVPICIELLREWKELPHWSDDKT